MYFLVNDETNVDGAYTLRITPGRQAFTILRQTTTGGNALPYRPLAIPLLSTKLAGSPGP